MSASWPEMPSFGDTGYDRSDWLVDTDPVELAREHRELLRIVRSHGLDPVAEAARRRAHRGTRPR